MKRRCLLLVCTLIAFALVSSVFVLGQGTDLGTIRGTVTDSSGALIPNARVTITDQATGTPRLTTTNSHGEYQIFGLPSGVYKVTISMQGMATQDITGVTLTGSDVVSANAVLKVSTAKEEVIVTAEAPIINTADQTITATISNREVIDLPRDSRDVYSFLYLNPNITQGTDDGTYKFLGFQSYGANFTLDGQRATNTVFGEPTTSQPSLEAVAEVNVLSNNFSAEYAGISNIRVTTKRGTSEFHGSVFYNNKNSALAAWQIQDKEGLADFVPNDFQSKYPTPYFNYNDVGGSFGGPIPKLKRTWFFTSYERNYSRSPVGVSNNKLPHPTLWGGDFSLLIDPEVVAPDPQPLLPDVPAGITLTANEIANNTWGGLGQQFVSIPSRLVDSNVQQLIAQYFPKISPSVQINTSNGRILQRFQTLLPGGYTRDLGTFRVDHDFSDKDRVYVVYEAQARVGTGSSVVSPFTGLGLTQTDTRDNTVSVSYVRTIHNNLINEARGGFNRENRVTHSNTTLEGFLSGIGFDSSAIAAYGAVVGEDQLKTHGHPQISYGSTYQGFTSGGRNTQRELSQYPTTFGDTLTWVINNHSLKMGADFVRNVGWDGFASGRGNPRGTMTYTNPTACAGTCNDATTDPFAEFILGLPPTTTTYIAQPRPPMDVHNWEQGYFFQDDWKATSKLTLNLGLRYELVSPYVDKNDIMLNFDPTFNNNTGRFVVGSDKTAQYLDSRFTSGVLLPLVTASQSGLGIGRGLVRTDKNNFAPRVGVAWRLGEKSVVRGGYGINFPTSAAQGIRDPLSTNAFNQALQKRNLGTPMQPWPTPLSGGDYDSSSLNGLPSVNAVPVTLHQPLIQQYNATFERQVGFQTAVRFSYLGTTSHGLIAGKDLNELRPNDTGWDTTQDTTGSGYGDGVTACNVDDGDCLPSLADLARLPYPKLGDYLMSFGNFGHSQSNAFQTQVEHRYRQGLMFNASYTYLDQKSSGLDSGNSSLGGVAYDPFNPERDYGTDSWAPHHRFVFYGIYDLPVGRGRQFGSSFSKLADAVIGGWQTSFQMFAKTGTSFTPFWTCDNCGNGSTLPGNIAVTSVTAVGDFSDFITYRPLVTGNYNHQVGDQLFDPSAFAAPTMGSDVFTNSQVAKRNILLGPGAWGVNLGLHKEFHLGERVVASLGADFNNLFNHPLRAPNADFAGGGGTFAYLGGFNIGINPSTFAPELKMNADRTGPADDRFNPNPDFGRAFETFPQEGVDSRRTVRLRLRITF
ncbi:MAG: carboxypeptidase regulatory-like domain-containing protein [Acidobacteriia bacterium]|nr:carboxypeptidase regulatory-like domain-containing protein [Terriglobia bacterium]